MLMLIYSEIDLNLDFMKSTVGKVDSYIRVVPNMLKSFLITE